MVKKQAAAQTGKRIRNNKLRWVFLLCLFGLFLNVACNQVINLLKWPLYLDTIGTIYTAYLGGALPGILVALLTNFILGFGNAESIYFGVLNVTIAVVAAFWMQSRKRRRNIVMLAIFILIISAIGGGIGALQTWVFDGYYTEGTNGFLILFFREKCQFSPFWAQFTAAYLLDVVDKILSTAGAMLLIRYIPYRVRSLMRFTGWVQTPLTGEELEAVKSLNKQSYSLGTKIVMVLMSMFVMIAIAVSGISLMLFQNFSKDQHAVLTVGVAEMAASAIDPEKVDEFIEKGEEAEGYLEVKELLKNIRAIYQDVEYVYVYRILENGCQVVFDLDTEEVPGDPPGTIVDFEPAMEKYLDAMKRGEDIETIVTNDQYGWLLTEYVPVYDSTGRCVCYAAADISMKDVRHYEMDFLTKLASLFLGFFALLLAIGLWLSNYHLVYPINTMAHAANVFAYDSMEAREKSMERLKGLEIRTKDELENLYDSFVKTTEDSVKYFSEMQHKTEMLSLLQSGLIMVLADMVENRDQSTGDHIKKTAAYAKIIMEKMRALGYHAEELTDQFISDVVKSAPLHDIGKIQVPDAILNKPGKLTADEFEIMKRHTTAGKKIIEQTIANMPEADYLNEAINLATYHHEKWNGTGYPKGLAGEDIPLSARVMAVADVFDALVSKRCYKEPFPFEKAMDIIREGAGNHFDPQVAEAFLTSEKEVREVVEHFENVLNSGESKDLYKVIS